MGLTFNQLHEKLIDVEVMLNSRLSGNIEKYIELVTPNMLTERRLHTLNKPGETSDVPL